MRAEFRRQLDMARRVRDFGRSYPDAGPSYTTARLRLEGLIPEAEALVERQSDGFVDERNAVERKRELCEAIMGIQLRHLAGIGRQAAVEDPGVERRLAFADSSRSYETIRAESRRILAEAAERRELLVKYGLDERVLDDLARSLQAFDEALVLGYEGRQKHIAATAALRRVAAELRSVVAAMDSVNRFRYASDPVALAAWTSARKVVTVTPAASPAADGKERDAERPAV